MHRPSTFKRAAVTGAVIAALFAASGASAGTITAGPFIAYGTGKDLDVNYDGSHRSLLLGATAAYTFDNDLGGRVIWFGDSDPYRGLYSEDRSLDHFLGVQAIGVLPLASHLRLTGGAGLGSTSLNRGASGGTQRIVDGILSIGLQVPMGRHFAMELRVDHLTASGVTSTGLNFQVPF